MTGHSLNKSASLKCPHQGTVSISTTAGTKADGATVATQADTTTVSGCTFTKPNGVPSPCLTVQWVVGDSKVKAAGVPSLSKSATGICFSAESIPQGSVLVESTQSKSTSL